MKDSLKSSAWYALRRPLPPWRFDELLAEMVAHLPRYRVDEVIVMVDVEEFFHGHPTPKIAAEYSKNLLRAKAALGEIGIAYSLNPWVTRGHEDRARHAAATVPGIQTVVHADGTQATCVACVLSSAWRENLCATWACYAKTQPRVLWIEDDIRDFGAHECFCPLHLERFSKQIGHAVTREPVAQALLAPGKPHPWRSQWLEMRAQATLEILRMLAAVIREASPTTHIGLMSSGPRNHSREGRDWMKVAQTLGATPAHPIYSRPTMGNYWEWGPPRGLYFSQDSIKITRHCLPAHTIDQSELESVPFSRYSKSVAFTFAQLAISVAYGCNGTTLDIFDFIGTPMESEPHYGRMLANRKLFLNALAEKSQQPGAFRGVRLHYHRDASAVKHLAAGDGPAALTAEGYPALEAFEAAGIPTTYDDSPVTFLVGQQPRSLDDGEIRTLLSRGLFLDGTAAAILCERGFAADIGMKAMQQPIKLENLGAFSAEEFANPDFGGTRHLYMSAQLPQVDYNAKFAVMQPDPRTAIVTQLVNPDTQPIHPAMTAFENSLGGRVIIHAWDYASSVGPLGISFHSTIRQRQMQSAVCWLFRNQAPLLVNGDGVYPLTFRKDRGDGTLLGFFNLSLDPWPGVEFEFFAPQPIAIVSILDADGKWKLRNAVCCHRTDATAKLSIEQPIALDQPLFVWIQWDQTGTRN
jgi:hypothetical protein